jgi:hypothetical protein
MLFLLLSVETLDKFHEYLINTIYSSHSQSKVTMWAHVRVGCILRSQIAIFAALNEWMNKIDLLRNFSREPSVHDEEFCFQMQSLVCRIFFCIHKTSEWVIMEMSD